MTRREVEFVFFDAGETLVHPMPSFPELFLGVCSEYGLEVDLGVLRTATRRIMAGVEDRQRRGYTFSNETSKSRRFWMDFYGSLVREMGYSREDGSLPQALYDTFSRPSNYGAYHDAHDILRELRGRGLRMGLISNFEPWLEDLLRDLEMLDYLEVLVISGKEGYEKPHPRIYELALERAGVSPRQSLHVGDSPISDYDGAREAGMRAVLLDRWGRFPDFAGEVVRDLRELPGLLD
ncbi:MAG: HAD-IA family hydrolase [Actinomycetota bacterium]|nr:HAD-IA family hydrolase [Actinomycetota bacterium]MDD5665781.1 HAD-IA family hydrolase [Actinomycetota bacterium]